MQDLYEERKSQFFSNLTDVEQWLKETTEEVQETLPEEREVSAEEEHEKEAGEVQEASGEDSEEPVDMAEVFATRGVSTLRSKSESQAAMDIMISMLKVSTAYSAESGKCGVEIVLGV